MNLLDRLTSSGLHPRQVSTNKGGEYACACPGCGGADKPGAPSDRFHAWPEQEGGPICQEAGARGTFWCRKCGAGGDVLEYLMTPELLATARDLLGAPKASEPEGEQGAGAQPSKAQTVAIQALVTASANPLKPGAASGGGQDFLASVAAYRKDHPQATQAEALREVVRANPQAHAEYLAAINSKSGK